jgi:nucleoside-triphosphatase
MGKTTVVRRLAELLRGARLTVAGFTTEELREGRARVGFAVETFAGERAILAHVDLPGPPRVGKYGVDVPAFERVALPALATANEADVVLVDEVGKMELASERFRSAVVQLFDTEAAIVATVQRARHPLTDQLKRRTDVETVAVTHANRGDLAAQLASRLLAR